MKLKHTSIAAATYDENNKNRPAAFNIGGRKLWANQYYTCYIFADGSKYAVGRMRHLSLIKSGFRFSHIFADYYKSPWLAIGSF